MAAACQCGLTNCQYDDGENVCPEYVKRLRYQHETLTFENKVLSYEAQLQHVQAQRAKEQVEDLKDQLAKAEAEEKRYTEAKRYEAAYILSTISNVCTRIGR